jgi:hypothetical protein
MKLAEKAWDLFISHASEDKETLVRPLAYALSAFGARVWYDELTIDVGDSLSRSIDKGISQSWYGLVVLSPSFFAKDWPEYELQGLVAKELGREKVIIPIWHQVNRDDVLKYSPTLADKKALQSKDQDPVQIAVQILSIIRPDLFTKLHKRIVYLTQLQSQKNLKKVESKKLMMSPIRHKELPKDLVGRVRLIRAALWGACSHSMEYWLDGFKRDAHPSQEIAWWEHVAAAYMEFAKMTLLSRKQHEHAFSVIFGICSGEKREDLEKYLVHLPDDAFGKLTDICGYRYPVYDIKEGFPKAMDEAPVELLEFLSKFDIEDFPSEKQDDE